MKHIEASKKIETPATVSAAAVKYSLVQRLRHAFHVETVGEGDESFSISASGRSATYAFTLGVSLKSEPETRRVRIMIEGQNELRMATKVFYVFSMFLVLVLNVLSGTGKIPGYDAITINAMFFLVVGGFIIYDHTQKIEEPQKIIERILDSLEAEFG